MPAMISNDEAVQFLDTVQRELTSHNAQHVTQVVSIIFSKVVSIYTPDQLRNILNVTPPAIQTLLIAPATGVSSTTGSIHLDGLVDNLVAEDKQIGRGLFRCEIQTLRIVIVVLKKFRSLFRPFQMQVLHPILTHQLDCAES